MFIFKFRFQKSITTIFSFLFLALLFVNATYAAPGDLDTSFGNGGIARAAISKFSADQGQAAALQADGKIVVAGSSSGGLGQDFTVSRVNADGTLDTSFGLGGKTARIPGFFGNFATAVVIQPDGKIVAGGFSRNPTFNNFALVRYNANGSVDASFGTNGVVQTSFAANASSILNGLAVQADGKIIAVGHTYASLQNSPLSIAVARYNPDGSLDDGFDGDGKLLVNFDQNSGNSARAVVAQPDGRILIGGHGRIALRIDCAIIRLNFDGTFDNTFDGDGKVTRQVGTSGGCSVAGLAVQPDGKIAAAVQGRIITDDPDVIALRFNPDGSVDNTFDGDGIASANIANDGVTGIVLQPDGKIVIAGYASIPAPAWLFIAARFNADGSPDTSFDGDGKVSTQISSGFTQERAALLQPDGKIVLAGFSFNTNFDISLVRYNPNGSLDTSFEGDGISHVELGNGIDVVLATAIQPDGKILAAGYSFGGVFIDVTVARFNSNGSLDASFGNNGSVRTPFAETISYARKIAVQPDGKIVVAVYKGDTDYVFIRYNADGSPDSSFGSMGVLTVPNTILFGIVNGLAIQPDGKIVAGGYSITPEGGRDITVLRLNGDGSFDASFGNNGVTATPDAANEDTINYLVLQPDGKIVVAGTNENQTSSRFVVSRYNNNGTLDASFGGGKVYTTFNSNSIEGANAVQVQTDGKIVAAGYASGSFALARYNTDGSLDNSFDGDGKVTTLIVAGNFSSYQIYGLGIQQSGKIVAAGTATNGTFLDGAVFRYNPDGTLDNTFGNAGKVITTINNANSEYYAMSLQADDKIVAGGYSSNGANDDFTLVRYLGNQAAATQRALFDFDGDNKSDLSVFRPSDGVWYLNQSQAGFTAVQFGIASDKIAPADYDGDGKTDLGVFRDGVWYLLRSQTGFTAVQFGQNGDLPRPADFDGDGKADLAVFRPSDGTWYLLRSQAGFTGVQFGANGDIPVPSDFDGDGKADINVYRPSNGSWYRLNSANGQFVGTQFGIGEDLPTPADYDGDGKSDISVFRPSDGTWYRLNSSNGSFTGIQFGATGDAPTAGDYDGDGKADISVFRPSNGSWYRINSTNSQFIAAQFGANGDKAVPSAHLP